MNELAEEKVNYQEIQKLSWNGIPHCTYDDIGRYQRENMEVLAQICTGAGNGRNVNEEEGGIRANGEELLEIKGIIDRRK